MKFYEALKEVVENCRKIRRPHWENSESVGRGLNYLQFYHKNAGTNIRWEADCADLIANDWEIVKEKVKKTQTLWINFYPSGNLPVAGHLTRADADTAAAPNRILCKEVTFEWEEEAE